MSKEFTPRSSLTHIGGWKLGKTLGRGAYAHVRLATHPNGHKAACKILPALHHTSGREVSWDETVDAIEAHKEVVFLKAFSGAGVPGVVGLEGVIEEGGWTYVFLTLYPASASAYTAPWPREHFVPFFRRLLYTIDILHQLDISHEDLKRSNVLVDENGLPVVVDFGFSHFKPNGGYVKSAGGTLDYSSPEKAADVRYDPRANDVWSLGILAMKLLGIPHPYAHKSDDDETSTCFKENIIEGPARYQFSRQDMKPGGIADLLFRMLDRNPLKRWKIPQILHHPYLRVRNIDRPAFKAPPCNLSFMHTIDPAIIEDLCFLAYINHKFFLCETPKKIIQRLHGKEPCWEKQWASILGAWSKRVEMDWEDIPNTITPLKSRSAPTIRNVRMEGNPGRALREIHLTPNVMQTPSHIIPAKTSVDKQKENMPPKKPRKSRIYGMKTKEGSTRNILGDVSPKVINKNLLEGHENRSEIQTTKPATSTAEADVGNGKKLNKVKEPTKKAKKNTIKKTAIKVYQSEAESSAQPISKSTTASKTLSAAMTGASTAVESLTIPGSSELSATVIDSSPVRDEPKRGLAIRGAATRKGKKRENVIVKQHDKKMENGSDSLPKTQMQGLKLAPNPAQVIRRRSPRLEKGEGKPTRV
ncbi:uncharacterized protein L201_002668 [Kwoniella dendrophila CBS 6074]|uniref:Protein kinase domain-containing protein n=1 Tax=Kwoniella dendrophila CBS 6074 TaxID=1295534 RepID=A0AAX4JQV2_9TREE